MTKQFAIDIEGQPQDVQVECKPCSKDGLKYICTLPDSTTFRMRKNVDNIWVAKLEDCPVDAKLIETIGKTYDGLSSV